MCIRDRFIEAACRKEGAGCAAHIQRSRGKYNGRVLARGGDHQHMEGSLYYQRHVIIEFPTYEEAVACHQSPEYQDARLFRLNGVGDNELVIVDGGDATT